MRGASQPATVDRRAVATAAGGHVSRVAARPSALADIFKAALTGTVAVNNKTYDGTRTGSGNIALNGVVAGDAVGTSGTSYTFADKNAGSAKTVTISGTTLTGADAGNYMLTVPATALADILKAALTGTVTVKNRSYDGTAAATGSVVLSGVVAGDVVGTTGTRLAFADKNAGSAKTVTISGTTLTGADAGNYTLSIPATALADILKAVLTGNISVNNKTYDGTTAPSGSVALSGVVGGDAVGTTGTSFTFANKNAGSAKTVTISGTTLTGADAGNYTLSIPAAALADILKAVLTGNITVNNKTYDGTTAASGAVALSGVVGGDAVGTTGTSFTFANKNAGTGKTVNVTGTTLTGADAGNYTLSIPATALADILKAALTGTITVKNKTYDGTTAAAGAVALNGVLAGDSVGTSGTSFTFADKNAGAGKVVAVSGTTLTGADAGNYTLTLPASALADILKKALTGTITVNGKTYDGSTAGSGSVALSGVVAGDAVGTTGSVFTFADRNAGTGKTVNVTGTTLNGVDAGNYTLSLSATALGDIARRVIALTADKLFKTQGASDPAFTYTLNSGSLVAGDAFSGALTRASGELPGPYAITQGTLSAGNNYTLTFTPGTLTINLDPVTQQPQTLRALTLPSQIQVQTPSSSNVTLDQQDLCGADKNCVVK
ncbi:YDG domain-containing protein [Sphingomonas sp. AR_OL41]|uniref:beta strand repeat-containing protein n=1 Tax=Sphingomonas sp. AR_OL41 TaxID=3042729 RepID=UPI00247FB2CF|nr:YDG domain-containing protein [Sphingomonas sp. AR_OL41]MDH7972884.1 YDG domain-containing protein [Sphingomonas sp. AR_OL41]